MAALRNGRAGGVGAFSCEMLRKVMEPTVQVLAVRSRPA